MAESVALTTPLTDAVVDTLSAGMHVPFTGVIYTARDAAHKRLIELMTRGEPLPVGAKSLAFHLTYQSQEANLRDSDVAKVRERIIRRVEREVSGKLRG